MAGESREVPKYMRSGVLHCGVTILLSLLWPRGVSVVGERLFVRPGHPASLAPK